MLMPFAFKCYRRSWRGADRRPTVCWPVLALTLIVLSGNGTAAAEELPPAAAPAPMPIPEMPVPPGLALPESAQALGPVAPEVPMPLAPPITTGFKALADNNVAIPPDTHGAVGPTQVMAVTNTEVSVHLHDGTPVGVPITLNTFWDGLRTPATNTFDPRVKFDPDPAYGGRWIWVSVQGSHSVGSGTLVAVSTDAEPNRGPGVLIDADPRVVLPFYWADYPTVGFNKNWVVVQVNMFDEGSSIFERTKIYVFDKAKLYAGTAGACIPAPSTTTGCTLIESTTIGATHVPAAMYDFAVEEMYLLNRWNSGAGLLRLFRIDGPIGNETLTALGFPASPVPWDNSSPGRVDFAPESELPDGCQLCLPGPCLIQTNDSRVQNVVYRDGTLWTAQTVFYPDGGAPTRSSIQWWQIGTDASVLQRGLVDDPTGERFYAFPSIAVNRHTDVLLGYSTFHDTEYAGANYSFRYGTDPLNAMQTEQLLKAGEDGYYKDLFTGRNRWGDYSHTVVDPRDDTKLWTIQEYADQSDTLNAPAFQDKWATWWGMVDPTRTITIDDVSMDEGDAGTTAFVFTLNLMNAERTEPAPSPLTITVSWDTSDGTATVADGDYVPVTGGLVTFAPGETTKTLTVDVNGDIKLEADEDFFVDLSSPVNAVLGDNQGKGTIANDDPPPQASIGDVQLIEGNGGLGATPFTFKITLSNPSWMPVDIDWTTMDGSALQGPANDYTAASGTENFAPGVIERDVVILVHGDLVPEPTEMFYVDLVGATAATLLKTRGVGTIIDDDAVNPGVDAVSAVAGGGPAPGSGTTLLQWFTPAGAAGAVQFVIEANQSAAVNGVCAPPPAPATGMFVLVPPPVMPGTTQSLNVPIALNPDFEYCYSIWIEYPGPVFSVVATVNARPYDSTGKVKWKQFSGASMLATPSVGLDAVVAPSNDALLHSMARSAAGGPWPVPWLPVRLGAVSQHRTPIVPLGGVSRAFIATQDGRVHAVNTLNGALLWSAQLPEGAAQGAPAGIFTAFGGAWDYLLVGTSSGGVGGDRLYARDPFTGAVIDAFPQPADTILYGGGDIGAILAMPSVDYASGRVYFASRMGTSGGTLWGLDLGPSSDALSLKWKYDGAEVDGSPVLHSGRVYVGNNNGEVESHGAADGDIDFYVLDLSDGTPKSFLFPDRRNDKLYVATTNTVWAVQDTGASLVPFWPRGLVAPPVVLHHPGTDDIYVGSSNYLGTAAIVKLSAIDGTIVSHVPLENGPLTIGPPSFDIGFGMLHVGSVAGIFYAVELPF